MIVVGGGDTGTDCIGTSVRHGAKQVRPGVSSTWSNAQSDYSKHRFCCPQCHDLADMLCLSYVLGCICGSCVAQVAEP